MGEVRTMTPKSRAPVIDLGPFRTEEEAERALARAHRLLDEAHAALGRHDALGAGRALEELGEGAELDPAAREMLAKVWLICGEPAKAAACFARVLGDVPDSLPAWRGLVEARYRTGAYAEAFEAARECVRLSPRDADAWLNLGVCARKCGEEAEGRRCFLEALELDPKLFAAWKNLGNSHRDAGKLDAAEQAYREALDLNPRRTDVLTDLASILDRQGRSDAALAAFREVVHVSPDDPDGWFNLTSACCFNGRLPEARGAYQRLLALDSGWARRLCIHVAGIFQQLRAKGLAGSPERAPLATPSFWEQTLARNEAPAQGPGV